ncbi:bacteriophage spp1 adsorption protein yueb [Bacillus sp. OxB-1]|uniref:type VII secretion protein EsaA n=1 Tax=Bacillus sp. (strain OxB-1) TaxID=98228 RepID=UPI000581BD0F|nr:type VII secretion protein EsaA [Bacillus sp. OxB-1]BAQ10912.1 bacteriophage spp1 adsorption protein yueb [Bacillus sp. OxB-1]
MSSNKKQKIRLIAVMLLILAIPIVFFQLLGGSLLHVNGQQKRIIAIVNEDLGDARDGESIEMGKEVVSILSDNSPYEWKVLGRGQAANGLKSNQYEAIVYIPSDFSERIMSYDERNPQKAEFSYQVQRQKDGAQKEKVLNEIKEATSRVNDKISTLYWSYVALEMDHIKKEFDTILTKETEFLDAMSEYYKPGSEALAEKMRQQKEQMEGIRSLIGNAGEAHNTHIQNAETFGAELSDFVSYVDQYKNFQAQQKDILLQVQTTSLEKIQNAAAAQTERFNESLLALEENNEELNSKITEVNEAIEDNKEKLDALAELRQQQVDRQVDELLAVQGTAIDRYNHSLFSRLEKELEEGKRGAGKPFSSEDIEGLPYQKEWQSIQNDLLAKSQEKTNRAIPNMAEEQQKSKELLAALAMLKTKVGEDELGQQLAADISQLETEFKSLNDSMVEKAQSLNEMANSDAGHMRTAANEYQDLYASFETLAGKFNTFRSILENTPADQTGIRYAIHLKEEALLKNPALSAVEQEQFKKLFTQPTVSAETASLMSYYAKLDQYEYMLEERQRGAMKQELLKDKVVKDLLTEVVKLNEEELAGWSSVGESIPQTELGMGNVSSSFAAIMSGYEQSMEEQHLALQSDLDSINEQAATLLAQLQSTEGEPVQAVAEGQVLGGQQNISSQLVSLSSQMASLSERQDGLVNYAVDLYGKANDLKDTSAIFSDKWQTNLEEMSEFQGDIEGYLANTYVDGQENGYVFNYLVNPLEIRGEALLAEEMKKVPPLILFVILLISSLLIGFFTHRFGKGIGSRVGLGMIVLLSLLVGLIISLYSVNMYILRDDRAIEWTVFTVLLLLAGAALIRAALDVNPTVGWIAAMVLMGLYMIPLLVLGVPEIRVPDLVSKVFISIKYEPETLFGWGATTVGLLAVALLAISYFLNRPRKIETSTAE